jgi:hypothetical protein
VTDPMDSHKPHVVTDEMIEAYDVAWKATPQGEPGDRRRAGILAALAVMPYRCDYDCDHCRVDEEETEE